MKHTSNVGSRDLDCASRRSGTCFVVLDRFCCLRPSRVVGRFEAELYEGKGIHNTALHGTVALLAALGALTFALLRRWGILLVDWGTNGTRIVATVIERSVWYIICETTTRIRRCNVLNTSQSNTAAA